MSATLLPVGSVEAAASKPEAAPFRRSPVDLRRRRIWALLLLVGFWMARPYYFPWTVEEERDADNRAMAAQGSIERQIGMPALGLLGLYMLYRTRRRSAGVAQESDGEDERDRDGPIAPKTLEKLAAKPVLNSRRFKGRLATTAAAYCAVCALSLGWSSDPALTLKRLVVFALSVLVVIALAKVFSSLELAELGFYLCGGIGVVAILCDIFITRSFAPFDPEYRFLGVMSSNSQGQNLSVCIFCGLMLMVKFPRHTRWLAPSIALAFLMLYLTRSRTATFTCLLLSLFFIRRKLIARFRPQTLLIAALLGVGVVGPVLVASGRTSDLIASTIMLGRDDSQNTASLSNRAPLWDELSNFVARRPILGYGYNSFWTPEMVAEISAHQGWGVPNGHNTFLDQELSLGLVGLLLFATVFIGSLIRAWRRYLRHPIPENLLPAVMLTWIVLTSLLESVPLDPFLPTFLAYVFLAQCLMPEGAATAGEPFITRGTALPGRVARLVT